MEGLYPIVRRARRPLIIQDDDAGPAPASPGKHVVPLVEPEQAVSYVKALKPKDKHAGANKSRGAG